MTDPCPSTTEALARLNANWAEDPEQAVLVPLVPIHEAYGVALSTSAVLRSHGWSHRNCVKIRHLRTMLLVEQIIPGGH